MNKFANQLSRDERGQSLVEFALMFMVITIILMGILDLGRLFFAYIALQNATGEGAAYAAINPLCPSAATSAACSDPNNVEWRTRNESPAGIVSMDKVNVAVIYDTRGITMGLPVTVSTTYNFRLATFVIASIVRSNVLPLRAQASSSIMIPVYTNP